MTLAVPSSIAQSPSLTTAEAAPATTAAAATTQAKTGSETLSGLLEVAFLGNTESSLEKLNEAPYPKRCINGASLLLSAPLGIAISPLSSASNCLSGDGIGKAGLMSVMAPASASAGISLMSGMRPQL